MSQRGSRRKAVARFAHRRHCAANIGMTHLHARVHRIAVVVRCEFPDDHRPGASRCNFENTRLLDSRSFPNDRHFVQKWQLVTSSRAHWEGVVQRRTRTCPLGSTLPHVRVTFTCDINRCVVSPHRERKSNENVGPAFGLSSIASSVRFEDLPHACSSEPIRCGYVLAQHGSHHSNPHIVVVQHCLSFTLISLGCRDKGSLLPRFVMQYVRTVYTGLPAPCPRPLV
jgi:hypothetical protein